VLRKAIAQSRRGYTMVRDEQITAFQKQYWQYLRKRHPRLIMTEPGDRGPNSTWIILKAHGFPKGVDINHKFNQRLMELAFTRCDIENLLPFRRDLPEDVIIAQRGNQATLAIETPSIDIRSDFLAQVLQVEEALQAAERLIAYATILVTNTTRPDRSLGENDVARLQAIAKYLPTFESLGFSFGQDRGGPGEMPWFEYSALAREFMQTAYDAGWVTPFDWGEWKETEEATRLRDDPATLADASIDQLSKLLTTLLRQDRFVEGTVSSAFNSGLLIGILRRATAILQVREQ
jgi:hypothetical protein